MLIHRRLLVGIPALAGALLIAACGADGGTRTPFATTDTPAATESDKPAPPETTSAPTQQESPAQPTGDSGTPAPPTCNKAAPSNVCGVVPQCGCAPTETCDVVNSSGEAACITAGKAPMGSACTATSGCALGLTCIGGTCHAFCDNPGSACALPNTGTCSQIKTQADAAIPNLAICRVACALHDPMSCGGKTVAGTGMCVVDNDGNTDCQTAGARLESEVCTPSDDCGPGLVCVTPQAGSSTCRKWCRVGQNDCGTGKTCNGFQTEISVGGVVYGACPQ